ncbi:MAG TPA: efflux RND transporter periplasmic adaptor subunit [Kiritimatiellia bacterium]|jgi:RND family efflux transporter MFP subunit|nr:efflux RND transporter periplasmic adaptor subunit [Kiritimatiellia bacterium]NCC91920.1 efflux RND transporter periplasmic adaptor subunit [Opitutae bacterium]HPC57372.1 efflux RND transporter periplasmic adaptor subunit [Kiritimatiellia bacterium]
MKKNLLLYAALVIALAPGCAKKPAESGSGPKAGRGPVPVRTALVERRDISEVLLFTGELESPLAVEVKPKIQGRLEKLELEGGEPTTEGAEVKAGEVIAELDRRELEAQVALAEAQARQAEVTLADRERERRRLEALFAEEVATEQARDAAVTAHESARAAEAQARAQLELAKVNLDETRIRAPMDGVVMERRADPGAMVGPSAAIVRIAQMNPLRLMLAIPARLLPMLEEGQTRVAVSTDVWTDREVDGTLARVFPEADPATRTVRAEVHLDNAKTNGSWPLRPGMYATARLTLATSPGALAVPASSVIRVLDRQLVFRVENNTARAADVKTGLRDGAYIEILEGLSDGDEYVVMGQNKLTDGAPIERVAANGAAEEPAK